MLPLFSLFFVPKKKNIYIYIYIYKVIYMIKKTSDVTLKQPWNPKDKSHNCLII